ncbi:MAG TPA: nitrilase-related carbon-nitrogen hydrolase [Solirubrobacteraceae bacterium]|nr:nitrilase-related carbon-nitrogen hydrolase [Solirubrobacteraceae bacterium]
MRVAAIQLSSGPDFAANLTAADGALRAAAADGATLAVLPEKWPALGSDEEQLAGAQPLQGPAVAWARAAARELQIDIVAGSVLELRGAERARNTSVHIGPDGEVHAVYSKIHMFDVEVQGRAYRESAITEPGEELVVTELADGTPLGLSVCYDLRFPELYRGLALAGARIIAIPAAFTLATTRVHWETLVRARAIEDQVFVIAANQVGEHGSGLRSGGRSTIIDPWGDVLALAGEEQPTFIAAELDFARQDEIRERLPSLAGRRPDAYHVREPA